MISFNNVAPTSRKMGDNSALPNIPGEEFEEDEEEEEDETKKENACDEVEEVTVKLPASLNTNVYEEKVEVLERKNEDDNDNVRENECGDDDVSEDGDDTEEGTRELYQHESIPGSVCFISFLAREITTMSTTLSTLTILSIIFTLSTLTIISTIIKHMCRVNG